MAGSSHSLTCCEPALLNHEGAPRSLHNSSRVHLRLALQDSKGTVTMRSVTSAPHHYILCQGAHHVHLHGDSIPATPGRRGWLQRSRLPARQPWHLMHGSGQSRATLQYCTPSRSAWHGPWGRRAIARG